MTAHTPKGCLGIDIPVRDPQAHLYPFLDETRTLFRCVRDHDFDTLAALCDDDFGIVDLDTEGRNVVVRSRPEWEEWFRTLFSRLDLLQGRTDTEIEVYQASMGVDMGFSVVEFTQWLQAGDQTLRFPCIVTIIWKRTAQGWQEARWHGSLLGSPTAASLPDA